MKLLLDTMLRAVLVTTLSWLVGGVCTASAAVQIIAPPLAGDPLDVLLVVNALPGGSSDGLTSVAGFNNGTLTLSFDPDVFEVPPGGGLQLSALLPPPSLAQSIPAPTSIGLAVIYASPLSGGTPPGLLATAALAVRAGAPVGPSSLTFRFDFNGGDIDFDPVDNPLARTYVVSRNVLVAIPEPSALLMLLAGLASVGAISHRRLWCSGDATASP